MKSQARRVDSGDHLHTYTIFFKDGRAIAVRASTFVLKPGGDLIEFYKGQGELNSQIFARSSQIAAIVSSADIAEVPAFVEMQSQIKLILRRLEALEQA